MTDVADALVMRRLFRYLFSSGLVMIATSNRQPTDLYKNGIQRDSFLPFIGDLEARCVVHDLASGTEHRTAFDYWSLERQGHGVQATTSDGDRYLYGPTRITCDGRGTVGPSGHVACAVYDDASDRNAVTVYDADGRPAAGGGRRRGTFSCRG